MFLEDDEIRSLTKRKHRATQMRELELMKVAYMLRSDGSLVVLRSHVEKLLGADMVKKSRTTAPDLSEVG